MSADRLDLERPRDATAIIQTAFSTWFGHLGVFIALAAIVAFPIAFGVDGLWTGALEDPDETGSAVAQIASAVIWALAAPLVTAMHVLVVMGLARGEHPDVRDALVAGVRVLPRVLAVTVLYILAVLVGLVLLVIPGIWLSVRLYFAAQVAVVEGLGGTAALRRSFALVQDTWWRAFGILILLSIVSALLAIPLGFVTQIIGTAADNGPLFVLGTAVAQTVTLSFTALAATILFFDLRWRHEHLTGPVVAATPPSAPLDTPERPL